MTDELDELFADDESAEIEAPASAASMTQEDEEQLRRISARVSSSHEEMDDGSSGGYSWRGFSPAQRLILAILVLLNIIVIGFGIMVVTGNFTL